MWFSLYWFFLLWLFLHLLLHLSMRWKFDFNFFRWTMFCFFLWKHPRRRAELEERNSGIDAGIVWMDEFLKFKQIRYCRGQGQDRSWILDVLTGQVWACQSQSKSVFVTSSHGYWRSSVQAICCGKKLNIYASTKHFNPNPNALPKAADGAKDATKLQFVWGIIAEVGYMIGDCICTQCHLSFCWLRPLL